MTDIVRNIVAILCAALLLCEPAGAMTQSQIPSKFNIPWANAAGGAYVRTIPQNSQIGIINCAASLTDGFPPLTFIPIASGGCPPFGQDFNGILKQITQWNQWQAAGGPVFYDSAMSTSIGGYPKGATLQSKVLVGRIWFSTVDNNTTDPDTTSATGWTVLPGTNAPGTPIPSLSTTSPPNTVLANGLTIGNASSNATNRANADTYWLFVSIWSNCASCQLFNSAGGAIAHGASANADFAANNALGTNNLNGTALIGADSMTGTTSTLLVGVPVFAGSRTVPGSFLGENLHALTSAENGPHNHGITDPGHLHGYTSVSDSGIQANAPPGGHLYAPGTTNATATDTRTTGISINSSGSGTAHNTVDRSMIVYWNLAL